MLPHVILTTTLWGRQLWLPFYRECNRDRSHPAIKDLNLDSMWQLSNHFAYLPQILKWSFQFCYGNLFFIFFIFFGFLFFSHLSSCCKQSNWQLWERSSWTVSSEELFKGLYSVPSQNQNPSQYALRCYLSNWTWFKSSNDTFPKSLALDDQTIWTGQPLTASWHCDNSGKSTPEHTLLITDGKVRVGTNS